MRVYAFISILLISCNTIAQSIPVTNLYDNRMFYNPAFVGNNPGVSYVTLTNRLLYRPNSGPLTLNMAMAEFNSCKLPSVGFGLIANQQNDGDGRLRTNLIRPIVSYKVKITESVLATAGIQFNMQNNYIDWSSLIFSDQIDPLRGNVFTSSNANANWVSTNNVNVGIGGKVDYYIKPFKLFRALKLHRIFSELRRVYDNKYYGNLGISYNNIGNNNDGLLGNNIVQRTRIIHGALAIATAGAKNNLDLEIIPNFRHQLEIFGTTRYQILDIGAYMQTNIGYLSFGHRTSRNFRASYNAVILGIAPSIKMNNNSKDAIRIAYHIDINYNAGNRVNAFANIVNHEISLIWMFNTKGCGKVRKVSICEDIYNDIPKLINSDVRRF
jgi:hypothetical protein